MKPRAIILALIGLSALALVAYRGTGSYTLFGWVASISIGAITIHFCVEANRFLSIFPKRTRRDYILDACILIALFAACAALPDIIASVSCLAFLAYFMGSRAHRQMVRSKGLAQREARTRLGWLAPLTIAFGALGIIGYFIPAPPSEILISISLAIVAILGVFFIGYNARTFLNA